MSGLARSLSPGLLARRTFLALGVAAIGAGCVQARQVSALEDAWIPFELFSDKIFFSIRVNERETPALLDSGASSTILDRTFAIERGMELREGGVIRGVGGTQPVSSTSGVTIEVGPSVTLSNMSPDAVDLSSVARGLGRPVPVILGRELFNNYVVDIDFPNRRIAFRDKAGFTPPAGATRLPVLKQGPLYSVPISIEGGPEGQALLDLGNSNPLLISRPYAEAHGILSGRRTSSGVAGGVGGMLTIRTMTMSSVQVAGVTFTNVPATMFDIEPQLIAGSMIGNLGLPIVSRFRAIADLSGGSLFLVPDPASLSAPFARNRAGLYVVRTGDGLLVQHVAAGSPAERGGWREGDVITSVDGQRIGVDYPGSPLSRWRQGAVGTTVALTVGSGPPRALQLEDYY